MDARELFQVKSVVPVVTIEDRSHAVPLASALRDAGFKAIEVTLRTPEALACIESLIKEVPGMLVGAGSVRRENQFDEISRLGVHFAVGPGATDSLLQAARRLDMPFVPGAVTASEMLYLLEQGYTLQKFFPAEPAGGLATLTALSAPLPEVRFFPTGGIREAQARQYLQADYVHCVGGSWFIPKDLLVQERFSDIGRLAEQALASCRG